jgi:hypothetical protein
MRIKLATLALVFLAGPAWTEMMVESSSEVRFQLDLHVPDAALAAYLPAGWAPNVAARGPRRMRICVPSSSTA